MLGASIGLFAGASFVISIPTIGPINSMGAMALGITGSLELTISGAQVIGVTAITGLIIMLANVGKSGGYEVKHYYPDDHQPPHVHIYGDDIKSGSHGIRVGIDGKPLNGEPELPYGAKKSY